MATIEIFKRCFQVACLPMVFAACASIADAQETGSAPETVAQSRGGEVVDLAKAIKNPVSDISNLPLETNFNMGGGLKDKTLLLVNFRPDFLARLGQNWNIVNRTLVSYADSPGAAGMRITGISDIQAALYLTKSKPGRFIWGAGGMLSLPTATHPLLQTGSWAAGPSGVALVRTKRLLTGVVTSQLWTYADAGQNAKEINVFITQPLVTYVFANGWALTTSPVITANWNAAAGQQWIVPVGMGFSKITVFNRQAISLGVEYYRNLVRPDAAAAHQLQFGITFLLTQVARE